jgi:hypothetical protein
LRRSYAILGGRHFLLVVPQWQGVNSRSSRCHQRALDVIGSVPAGADCAARSWSSAAVIEDDLAV